MAEIEKVINPRKIRKDKLVVKLQQYLNEYKNILVVQVDNVGSNQMQRTRIALRGKAVLLMGKNTLMRKVIREMVPQNPNLENLLQFVYGNMGLVLTNGDLNEIRQVILLNKTPAAAKSGSFAPADVWIPAGPTGMDPGQTSFFQALNIGTKIVKGTIEIINQVHLIKPGDKVTMSHVALLTKLNILPFFYGFKVTDVYENGTTYSANILDMTKEELTKKFFAGVQKIAAISLAISYPTVASLPHIVAGGFAKLLAISLVTDYSFPESQKFKDYLANPGAFASSAPAAGSSGSAPAASTTAAAKPVEKPKSEESEADMGFSLFD
jgi:large subunit ribosomal protein LP0